MIWVPLPQKPYPFPQPVVFPTSLVLGDFGVIRALKVPALVASASLRLGPGCTEA